MMELNTQNIYETSGKMQLNSEHFIQTSILYFFILLHYKLYKNQLYSTHIYIHIAID